MKNAIKSLIFFVFLMNFSTNLFGQVYLNHTKEPKIILDEPKQEIKNQSIKKEEIPAPTPTTTQKENTTLTKESKVIIEPTKDIVKDINENEKKISPEKSSPSFVSEDKQNKQNIELLKKEKEEIKTEAPKKIINDKKYSKNEPIGLVFASGTIGKYGIESSNVAMTYLVNKNTNFQLEVIDMELETKENITKALDTLNEKGIKKVIFLVTNNNLWGLNSYPDITKFDIYLPLINKSTVANPKQNFIFGGMDYKKQFQFLTSKASSHLVEIYDESSISKNLHDELAKLNLPNIKYIQLVGKNPNYNPLFSKSNKIKNSTLILNTSIVKSAIILALLRGNNIEPKETLATQLNYSPVIFNLTQPEDRNNLFVANSIELLPRNLEELISFFGEDVVFNWVNYTTILGLEYFMTNNKKLFGNIEIKENQVNYPVKLFGFEGTKFVESKR